MRDKPLPILPQETDKKLFGTRPAPFSGMSQSQESMSLQTVELGHSQLQNIFRHLDYRDLCRCCQVSKSWHQAADDNDLWFELCDRQKWYSKTSSWKSCYAKYHMTGNNWLKGKYRLSQVGYDTVIVQAEVHGHIRDRSGSRKRTGGLTSVPESLTQPKIRTLPAHSDAILASCLDDNMLVTASKDGRVKIWDLDTKHQQLSIELTERHVFYNGTQQTLACPIYCIAVIDNYVVAGLANGDIKFWNKFTGEEVAHLIKEHTDAISDILVLTKNFGSLDDGLKNSWLVTSSFDRTCRSYCLQSQGRTSYNTFDQGSFSITLRSEFSEHSGGIFCLTQRGQNVVSAGYDNFIRCWNARTGVQCKVWQSGTESIVSVKVMHDVLIAASIEGKVQVWNNDQPQYVINCNSSLKQLQLKLNQDNVLIITSTFDGLLNCWLDGKQLWFLDLPPGLQEDYKRNEVAIGTTILANDVCLLVGDQFGRLWQYHFDEDDVKRQR